jgi:hypothetical protein
LVAPLNAAGFAVDGSGRKEIANWSGGVPILTVALLEKLAESLSPPGSCTKNEVDALASAMLDERRQLLAELWEDCDVDLRSDLAVLAAKETEGIPLSELSDARQRALEQRGLVTSSGNRMRASCRLMAKFALQRGPAIADLKRLFGTRDGFDANIRVCSSIGWLTFPRGRSIQLFAITYRAPCGILSQIRNSRSRGYAASPTVPWR